MKWGVRRARKKYSNKSMCQYKANEQNAKLLKRDLDSNRDSTTGSRLDSQTQQDIQKMTTVSEIKNRYKSTARKNVYYPFA